MSLLIGSALVGAGVGLYQNYQRKEQAQREADRAGAMYEYKRETRKKGGAILDNQLSIGAMQNTSQSREAAIQAAQQQGMREAALGQTGMSGGTPFYALDSEIQQNTQRLAEMSSMMNMDFQNQVMNAENQQAGMDMELQQAMWGLQDADEQLSYLNSGVAWALSGATGALAGASTANNLMAMGTQMGIGQGGQKAARTASVLDASDSDYMSNTGSNLFAATPSPLALTPARYNIGAKPWDAGFSTQPGRQVQDIFGPSKTFDFFGMGSAKAKGIGSDSILGQSMLRL